MSEANFDIRIAVAQLDLTWKDPKSNLLSIENILTDLGSDTDILLLPEMFSTGFTMSPESIAEPHQGPSFQRLKELSSLHDLNIVGSIASKVNGKFYNRLYSILPDGSSFHYDKINLFSYGGEKNQFTPGTERLIYSFKSWNICPLVCYDLRFPSLSDHAGEYDLLLYSANWPDTRIAHWDHLLKARAIENQAYTVACNRIGEDGNNLKYVGHSVILDYEGKELAFAKKSSGIICHSLSKNNLLSYREKLPFLLDK